MKPLKKRLLMSSVFVAISIFTIFFAAEWFFVAIITGMGLLALNEFMDMAKHKGIVINRPLGLILGAVIPTCVYFQGGAAALAVSCMILLSFHFIRGQQKDALMSVAVGLFGLVYISYFLSYFISTRLLPNGPELVFYVIFTVKMGDAGAYFVGRKIGKHKLIEHISPNKSVEGAVAQWVTSILVSALSKIYLPEIPMIHLIFLGMILGALSQVGDLAESVLKRDAGVKDSGVVPGLGGVLDVLDSLLLTVPLAYYYLRWQLGGAV